MHDIARLPNLCPLTWFVCLLFFWVKQFVSKCFFCGFCCFRYHDRTRFRGWIGCFLELSPNGITPGIPLDIDEPKVQGEGSHSKNASSHHSTQCVVKEFFSGFWRRNNDKQTIMVRTISRSRFHCCANSVARTKKNRIVVVVCCSCMLASSSWAECVCIWKGGEGGNRKEASSLSEFIVQFCFFLCKLSYALTIPECDQAVLVLLDWAYQSSTVLGFQLKHMVGFKVFFLIDYDSQNEIDRK